MLITSMLLFFWGFAARAQNSPVIRSHAINAPHSLQANVPDTLTIVAVRVAFHPDQNRLTTGDGTYNSGNLSYLDSPDITIDPLPHDQSYFESHLEFAKNYFEKVSGQQIHLRYRILPDIYQLPQKMETYSPTGKTFTNEKLAMLVRDTWQTINQQGGFSTADLDPQKTAFIIFHAGVGRDIKLTGTTLDKTPQDIPSLFLGKKRLGNLLNQPNFDGFPINGTNFNVTNSIILPQTLSRPGVDVTGQDYVLQLSLNGLLCASIGSYLGLPDLFNTQTGNSGIGRFGLMDGESFFSYHGLFPPEPSAWEKAYLGWQHPFHLTKSTSGAISLPAAAFHQDHSIAKYNLSNNEYFLVENRHRDLNNDGVTLTIRRPNGQTVQKKFTNNDETFVNQSEGFTDLFPTGVITDVSNFDWSLPGGSNIGPDETANTGDDRNLNGGILIWHIDEGVINRELESRTVNANPQRRGVDLEEADGVQDIGQSANDNFSEEARGTAFDFWWKGNDASVVTLSGDTLSFYQNRFGPDTRPSNESNSGAPNYFEFYNFSENQPVANFKVKAVTNANIHPTDLPVDSLDDETTYNPSDLPYFDAYPLGISIYKASGDSFLVVPSQQSVYAINLDEDSSPVYDFKNNRPQQPYGGNKLILGEAPESAQITLSAWQWDGTNWNTSWNNNIQANSAFLSSVNDQVLLADFTDQRINIALGTFLPDADYPNQRSTSVDDQYSQLENGTLLLYPKDKRYTISSVGHRFYTGALKLSPEQSGFYLLTDNKLMIFDPNNFSNPQTVIANTLFEWPAITDIDGDAHPDFIYVNKETHRLEARNERGAMLPYFPIAPPKGSAFSGTPIIVQDHAGTVHIYIVTQDSLSMNIRGYSANGKRLDGFPLYIGGVSKQQNQPVNPILTGQTLFAVSHHGELKAWKLNTIQTVLWASRYGNDFKNKPTGNVGSNNVQEPEPNFELLVKEETYNWPNPAHDFTNIRYQTNKAADISIKIITTGGTVVFDKKMQSHGDVAEELRIATQRWSSGLYLGMITAKVDGKKSRKMIKIVVVH